MKILHVTVHMGGGVGKAIADLVIANHQNEHSIILLQRPEKTTNVDLCINANVKVVITPNDRMLNMMLRYTDAVIIHWWHHPLMCYYLYHFPSIPVRCVLWSHISGCTYPFLSYDFTRKFQRILITSKYSLENPYWTDEQRNEIVLKSRVVYGLGQLSKYDTKKNYSIKKPARIGYVGTLAESKLHPDFVKICKLIVDINPEVDFFLLGDSPKDSWILQQAKEYEIEEKIHCMGYVENINEWLKSFDIFAYPLNPYHYATTENAILEAMAVGLPIVLLNQATEKYIIDSEQTGILAENINTFATQVCKLIEDENTRRRLGQNAITSVMEKFSFTKNIGGFNLILEEVMDLDKTQVDFKSVLGETPYQWFRSALNQDDQEDIEDFNAEYRAIFREKSKSSIYHFACIFPDDKDLKKIINQME